MPSNSVADNKGAIGRFAPSLDVRVLKSFQAGDSSSVAQIKAGSLIDAGSPLQAEGGLPTMF